MPQCIFDDAQVGPLTNDRFRVITAHGHASVGTRHLAPLRGPVAPSTDVALIVQHRSDGRILPTLATIGGVYSRRLYAFSIQRPSNRSE